MTESIISIIITICSGLLVSFSLNNLLVSKKRHPEPDIADKIKNVSSVLSQSSTELINLQKELEGKLEYVNQLNEEANQVQNLLSLSHNQIEAIKTMLNQETQKENKINFWKSVLVNFIFFCSWSNCKLHYF